MATTNIQSFPGDIEVGGTVTGDGSGLTTLNGSQVTTGTVAAARIDNLDASKITTGTLGTDRIPDLDGSKITTGAITASVDTTGSVKAASLYTDDYIYHDGDTNTTIRFPANDTISMTTSGTERMRVTSTGNVGIGTNAPAKTLEVQGTLRVSNVTSGDNTDLLMRTADSEWSFQNKVIAPDRQGSDEFGRSVDMSADGSYAIVAAKNENGASPTGEGAAYIYVREGSKWNFQQKIEAPDGQVQDYFGRSVAISPDGLYAVAGATHDDDLGSMSGSAYIFERYGSTWTFKDKITAPDGETQDFFGHSVAISSDGSYVIVGAYGEDPGGISSAGSVYVYLRNNVGSVWSFQQKLAGAGNANDNFGYAVDISSDGSYAIVGAHGFPAGSYNGAIYIFVRSGTSWSLQNSFSGGAANDGFGESVSISADGTYVIAGVPGEDLFYPATGAARIYVRSGASWAFQQQIDAPDKQGADYFGRSVSISSDGSYAFVGAPNEDPGGQTNGGSCYMYSRGGTTWTFQQKITAPDKQSYDVFGYSVAISGDGNYILAGAHGGDAGDAPGCGEAYFFRKSPAYLSTTTPIEASGTILSFTGQHTCFPEGPMSQGLVVSANKNKYMTLNGPLATGIRAIKSSESLPVVSLSNVVNDCSTFGVVDHFENGGTSRRQKSGATIVSSEKELGDNRVIVNSLGEGAVWVANTNGPLESGDYITTSNIAGYGQKQDDDILHSYTVAKITMDCDFDPEDVPIHVIKKDENGQNILDNYGRIQWEEVPDQTEKEYRIRYLTTDGGITDQANAVWKAAYVGCTYHCG